FRPVAVTLGPEHEGTIVVLDGLEEGQQVVTSGQFLIDSEASLSGAYQRLDPSPQPSPRKRGEGAWDAIAIRRRRAYIPQSKSTR
ncbi:MAG: hypothetical protein ACT4OU_10160, partial [Hyphomicrobium sp.]